MHVRVNFERKDFVFTHMYWSISFYHILRTFVNEQFHHKYSDKISGLKKYTNGVKRQDYFYKENKKKLWLILCFSSTFFLH